MKSFTGDATKPNDGSKLFDEMFGVHPSQYREVALDEEMEKLQFSANQPSSTWRELNSSLEKWNEDTRIRPGGKPLYAAYKGDEPLYICEAVAYNKHGTTFVVDNCALQQLSDHNTAPLSNVWKAQASTLWKMRRQTDEFQWIGIQANQKSTLSLTKELRSSEAYEKVISEGSYWTWSDICGDEDSFARLLNTYEAFAVSVFYQKNPHNFKSGLQKIGAWYSEEASFLLFYFG